MAFLEKFDGFNRRLSGWFEWVGLGGLLAMMAITCIDVFGAKIFRSPLYGALDIVVLAQMVGVVRHRLCTNSWQTCQRRIFYDVAAGRPAGTYRYGYFFFRIDVIYSDHLAPGCLRIFPSNRRGSQRNDPHTVVPFCLWDCRCKYTRRFNFFSRYS